MEERLAFEFTEISNLWQEKSLPVKEYKADDTNYNNMFTLVGSAGGEHAVGMKEILEELDESLAKMN